VQSNLSQSVIPFMFPIHPEYAVDTDATSCLCMCLFTCWMLLQFIGGKA